MADAVADRDENVEVQAEAGALTGMLIITVGGEDDQRPLEEMGLTMDSTHAEIMAAARGIADEIAGEDGELEYTSRKAFTSENIYVYPKPEAG